MSLINTHDDAGRPRVKQEEGADEERAGEHHADGQQQPVSQTNILFPEEERVAVGVGREPLPAVVAADGPHALDGLHKLRRLPEPVEVEGELCVFNGLSSRDWKETQMEERLLVFLVQKTSNRLLTTTDDDSQLCKFFLVQKCVSAATPVT